MRKILLRRSVHILVALCVLLLGLAVVATLQKPGTESGPIGAFLKDYISLTRPALAQEATTTFPVNEAGIAGYVQLDNIENIDIDALAEAYHTIEASGESYVIGTVVVPNEVRPNYPHLYVGLDGWMIAYYLNTEETSRIMQWKNYEAGSINTTTLRDAIDYMCGETELTYSEPIKYYDFEFPEANKMTLVAETGRDSFYVNVPGTLYEASFQVILCTRYGSGELMHWFRLKVDETLVFQHYDGGSWQPVEAFSAYGYYDLLLFETGIAHHVVFDSLANRPDSGYATVLIYRN